MVRIQCYTDKRTMKAQYSVELFHNNKYIHKGVFEQKAFDSFMSMNRFKSVSMCNVLKKSDLIPKLF